MTTAVRYSHACRLSLLGFAGLLAALFTAFSIHPAAAVEVTPELLEKMPNPLKSIQPGQWVQYRIQTQFGEVLQKQTLVDVTGTGDERTLTIKTEMYVDDEMMDERTDSVTFARAEQEQEDALRDAKDMEVANTKVDVKGREIDAVEVSFSDDDGQRCHLFLSESVPLVGVIRLVIEGHDEPAMELVDFGN